MELLSTGGTAKTLRDAGLHARCRRGHGIPGNDGRPRQDAAPEGAWRPAGPRRRGRCGHGRARHRRDRPAGAEPLSVRSGHRPGRLHPGRRGGEHRHRRTGDAALGSEELRARGGGHRSLAIRGPGGPARRERRRADGGHALRAVGGRVQPRPSTTRRSAPTCPPSPTPRATYRRAPRSPLRPTATSSR